MYKLKAFKKLGRKGEERHPVVAEVAQEQPAVVANHVDHAKRIEELHFIVSQQRDYITRLETRLTQVEYVTANLDTELVQVSYRVDQVSKYDI